MKKFTKISLVILFALFIQLNGINTFSFINASDKNDKTRFNKQIEEIVGYKKWQQIYEQNQEIMRSSIRGWNIEIDGIGDVKKSKSRQSTLLNKHGIKSNSQIADNGITFSNVYVNKVGEQAFLMESNLIYPTGTVFVRETLLTKNAETPEQLTIMIKRNKGFNRANGDWEFLILDSVGKKIESRREIESCLSCHYKRKENDFIFYTFFRNKTN